jgi:hypothetical protein
MRGLHRGEITFTTEVGKGTTFIVIYRYLIIINI